MPVGLGDVVEVIAKPVAKAFRLGCIDEKGKLREDSKCAKRREFLNKLRIR